MNMKSMEEEKEEEEEEEVFKLLNVRGVYVNLTFQWNRSTPNWIEGKEI